jgi:hypothetical protein
MMSAPDAPSHLVALSSVEDDAHGDQLTVFWEVSRDSRSGSAPPVAIADSVGYRQVSNFRKGLRQNFRNPEHGRMPISSSQLARSVAVS